MRNRNPADSDLGTGFERDDLAVCRQGAGVEVRDAVERDLERSLVLRAESEAVLPQRPRHPLATLEREGPRELDVDVVATLIRRRRVRVLEKKILD